MPSCIHLAVKIRGATAFFDTGTKNTIDFPLNLFHVNGMANEIKIFLKKSGSVADMVFLMGWYAIS